MTTATLIAGTAAALQAQEPTQPRKEVITIPGRTSTTPLSPGVRSGNLVFFSGQLGTKPGTRELVSGGISAEVRQALENLKTVATAAGVDMSDILKCTVFLAPDMRYFDAMNKAYAEFFPTDPPARTTVGVNQLAVNAAVEIECIGVRKE